MDFSGLNIPTNKLKDLEEAVKKINKDYGKGSVMQLNDNDISNIPRISTGVLALDSIIGGGYPLGRIIELYGPESSGKTTFALKAIASFQKEGHACAFIDAEHALDPIYAKNLGVDIDEMLISQPDTGEIALGIVEALVRSGAVGLVVVDSVAALVPKAEIDGDMGDAHVGLHARLMSQAMRKLTGIISKTNTVVIFINQIREKVGVMYGNPETTTGGRALKFYSSIRIDIRKKDPIKNGTEIIGNKTKIKIVKNKTYPPFKEQELDILYGIGPDNVSFMIDFACDNNIIQKSGAWYTFNNNRFQGKNSVVDYLKNDDIGKSFYNYLVNEYTNTFNDEAKKDNEAELNSDSDSDSDSDFINNELENP